MFPTVKPTKFTYEIEEILKNFSKQAGLILKKDSLKRLDKDNTFNKRFSGILDAFSDIKSVTERITENIQVSIKIESRIQQLNEADNSLREQSDKLVSQNKTDLKSIYFYSKVFLDEYTAFLSWIFDWRDIRNSSITEFYKSLGRYKGVNQDILLFKETCFEKIKAIDNHITNYRDKKIVHNGDKHKQDTKWFFNGMNGSIKFIGGGKSSITPQEVLFIVVEYIDCTTQFCLEWLNEQI